MALPYCNVSMNVSGVRFVIEKKRHSDIDTYLYQHENEYAWSNHCFARTNVDNMNINMLEIMNKKRLVLMSLD